MVQRQIYNRRHTNDGLKDQLEALWAERKANIDYQFDANNERLKATAKVLEHRLEVLNHAHEQSIQDGSDFVNRKEYNAKMDDIANWQHQVNKELTILTTRSYTWTLALGIFFVFIQIVLKFWEVWTT